MTLHRSPEGRCKGVVPAARQFLRVSSYGAATLAVGFFLVTCYVIFKDVADGAPITPDHVMSFAVLVGTIASGHLLWGQLQEWRLLPALGLLILFIAGTFYCVTASGGRNAAVQSTKAEQAHKTNDDRARVEGDLTVAKERLSDALTEEARECASGEGPRCKGWRKTREERQANVHLLEAELRLMEPERVENPELRHAAKVFVAFPGVTASEQVIFGFLVLYFPFVKALFCEIATLVFGSIGFRHSPTETLGQSHSQSSVSRDSPNGIKGNPTVSPSVPLSKPEALQDLLSLIRDSGTVPSQDTLRLRWDRPKSTVSRWLIEFERASQISRSQQGKCKSITTKSTAMH